MTDTSDMKNLVTKKAKNQLAIQTIELAVPKELKNRIVNNKHVMRELYSRVQLANLGYFNYCVIVV